MNYLCKGCIENDACPVQDAHKQDICPCTTCLVKVMCETGCNIYDRLYGKYFQIEKKKV